MYDLWPVKVCITCILTSCKEIKYCHGWWVFIISICGNWRSIINFLGSCKVILGLRVSQSEMFIRKLKSENDIPSCMGKSTHPIFLSSVKKHFLPTFYVYLYTPKRKVSEYISQYPVGRSSGSCLTKTHDYIDAIHIHRCHWLQFHSGTHHCDQVVESHDQGQHSYSGGLICFWHFPQNGVVVSNPGTQTFKNHPEER